MSKIKAEPINTLLDRLQMKPTEYIRTGCLPFDLLFEGKGLPLGVYGVIFASSGFGKTTTLMSLCKSMSAAGHKSIFAMVEPSVPLAEDMGLASDPNFAMPNITTFAELESLFNSFMESDYTLLIIDSITAVALDKVIDQEVDTQGQQPASSARVSSELLKLINARLKNTGKAVIITSQERANFNGGWNAEETTMAGGYSLKFYSGYVIRGLGAAQCLDPETKSVLGTTGYLICPEKNRFSAPRARSPIQVLYGKGQSNVYALTCYMQWKGYFEQAGATFKINFSGKEESVKGRAAFMQWVKTNVKSLTEDFYNNTIAYFQAYKEGWKPSF